RFPTPRTFDDRPGAHGPDNGVGRAPGPTRETVHLTDMSTFHPRTHSLGEVSPIQVPDAPVVLSSASVYPEKTPVAFEIAAKLGYDGRSEERRVGKEWRLWWGAEDARKR